jgi:isopenicillin-N N-acyltransferase-like protein
VKRVISAEIPLIQAAGSHYQVGEQIGAAMRDRIHRMIRELSHHLPATRTWQQLLEMGAVFQAFSRSAYPQYMEELQGMADAAAVSFGELFLLLCEELWERPLWGPAGRGCTDMAARGAATTDGATLLAHTNDLAAGVESDLVILQVQAGDEPEFLGVSVGGVGYSAGFNAAGISLTGNELSSNDVRPGVPRLLVVRAILAARRLGEAMDACLLPQRASSYNNIIADSYGEVYSMEGSATDCEAVYIDGDTLAHANHYAAPPMRRFEADRNEIGGSIIRHNRAMRLLREHYGHLSPERFRLLLADHANYPASICKHEGESVTAFSIIIDLSTLRAWIGHGRPCQTAYREFSLAPWTPPAGWPRPPHLPVK